jgi:hypothetical protein
MDNSGPANMFWDGRAALFKLNNGQFNFKQHFSVDINTSDALHTITRRGKNDDYNWLSHHNAYVL